MKTTGRGAMVMSFLLAISLLASCSTAGEDEMKERQMEIRSELEHSIAETEAAIDRVERDRETATEEMLEELNMKLDLLEESRDDLRDKLDRVGDTTADQWDEFQLSVRRAVDNAKQTLREV